jgi:O-antigen/teichoic acid export membrane protein
MRWPWSSASENQNERPIIFRTSSVQPAPGLEKNQRVHRFLTLTIIDQAVSSVSNFLLAVIIAHYNNATNLGYYALVFTTYSLVIGVSRSLTSDCLLTRSSIANQSARREQGGYLFALIISSAVSLVILGASVGMSGSLQILFLTLACTLPFMAVQDYSRYIGISRHKPNYAIKLDIAWLVLFILSVLILHAFSLVAVTWLFGAWAATGAIIGAATARPHLVLIGTLGRLRYWMANERNVGLRFSIQFMLNSGVSQACIYSLAVIVSVQAVGWIKLAQLALGPIAVIVTGAQSALIASGHQRWQSGPRALTRFISLAGIGMAGSALLWTILVYLMPLKVGSSLLGSAWPEARHLVLWIGIGLVLGNFAAAAAAGLRAMRAAREGLLLAVAMVPVTILTCLGGAATYGAKGFAIGTTISYFVLAILGSYVFFRSTHVKSPEPT